MYQNNWFDEPRFGLRIDRFLVLRDIVVRITDEGCSYERNAPSIAERGVITSQTVSPVVNTQS